MATSNEPDEDDLRPEYDLRQLERVPGERRHRRPKDVPTGGTPSDNKTPTRPVSMTLNPDETKAFIARMDSAMMPLFLQCVLPIYAECEGAAIQVGTGTLFRVAEYSFLVTAAHVTEVAAKRKSQLYVTDSPQGSPGIVLEGLLHSEAKLDVSLWELAPQVVASLPHRKFLTIHHADRANARAVPGWYYLHGYPNCWSNVKPDEIKTTVKAFTYGTVLYSGDTSEFPGYNPEIHILLTAPKNNNVDSHGAETEMPHSLEGISGCSIWQAYYSGLASSTWTVDDALVMAVETGVYQKGTVVRGTRWWVIEKILSKHYRDLEGPMSILTPYMRRLPR